MRAQLSQCLTVVLQLVGHDSDGFADGTDPGGPAEGCLRVLIGELRCDVDKLAGSDEMLGDDLGVGFLQRAQLAACLRVQLRAGDALRDSRFVPAFAAGASALPIIAFTVIAAEVLATTTVIAATVVLTEPVSTIVMTEPVSAIVMTEPVSAIVPAEVLATAAVVTSAIISAPVVTPEILAAPATVVAAEPLTTTAVIAPAAIATAIIAPEVLAASAAVTEAPITTLRAGLLMALAAAGTLMPAVVAAQAVLWFVVRLRHCAPYVTVGEMPAQSIAPVRSAENSHPRHLPLNSRPTWASNVGICPSALNWRTCMPRFISGLTALSVVSLTALAPVGLIPATAANPDYFTSHSAPGAEVELSVLGSHRADIFDAGAAEIVAHYAAKQQTLVVNAEAGTVQVLDSSSPEKPTAVTELTTAGMSSADGASVPAGAVANSVAVRADGLAAVALEAPTKTDEGWVGFFDLSADEPKPLGAVRAGALPDSVVFDDEGRHAVVANEGEPAEDYSVDPEGTVNVVSLPEAVQAPSQEDVKTADFRAFEGDALPEGVRVFGGREDAGTGTPEYPVSENLEPEYSTVIGGKAYVTLQEANAIAVVDLASARTEKLMPLGTQDVSEVPFDVSNKDEGINRANWPVQSFLQPDTIRSIEIGGHGYLLTANEGDTRDWDGYSEEIRVKDLGSEKKGLAPICESVVEGVTNPDGSPMTIEDLQKEENLGRLTITKADGLKEDGSCYETIYGVGGRSFSIFDTDGKQIFDSADDFERITAEVLPKNFNSNNSESNFDNRSDDKGPEPEAIEVGQIGEKTYAFIGMERIGGIFVYDITDPAKSEYVTYVNNRNFAVQPENNVAEAGDSGPESIVFVPSADLLADGAAAAAGEAGNAGMLIVGNEVTGSTTFYAVDSSRVGDDPTEEPTADPTGEPTDEPTGEPTDEPTSEPTADPTDEPTQQPSQEPTQQPTQQPTDSPSTEPSVKPSDKPGDDDKGRLPRTGAQIGALAGLGALLAAAGGAVVWIARRRS